MLDVQKTLLHVFLISIASVKYPPSFFLSNFCFSSIFPPLIHNTNVKKGQIHIENRTEYPSLPAGLL